MDLAKKIKNYFIIVLSTTLLLGCDNMYLKNDITNKPVIDNDNVLVNQSSKKDNNLTMITLEKELETINIYVDDYDKKSNILFEISKTDSIEEKLKQKDFYVVRNLDNLETVKFGKYEQDGNLQNGKEDIEWLIVTKNEKEALLLSKHTLDCKPFSSEKGKKNFEGSYLYGWLNNYFYQEAFGDIDKNKTIIKGNVGLLKYEDILKYFVVNDNKKENQQIGSDHTDYAVNVVDNYEFNVDELDIMTSLDTSALHTSDDCWYRNNNPYYILDKNMSCAIVNSDGTIYLEDVYGNVEVKGYNFNGDETIYLDDSYENLLCIGIRPTIWVKII